MPSPSKKETGQKQAHARHSAAVESFIASLSHAQKPELIAVRDLILSADPTIHEGVKWNAPSFWRSEWFATFHLRSESGLMLIIHCGAKAKARNSKPFVEDPDAILQWLASDRCAVVFADMTDVKRKAGPLRDVIRRWVERLHAEAS